MKQIYVSMEQKLCVLKRLESVENVNKIAWITRQPPKLNTLWVHKALS